MAKFGFDWYFKANEFEFCSFSYYTTEQFLRIFIRLVYSARATGCCNEAILFVLVYFTSIVGSISNEIKCNGTIVLALEELGCYYLRGMSVGNHLNVRVIRELFLKFLQFAPAEGGYC